MIGCDDLFFLRFCVAVVGFQHASRVAILAPILLASTAIVPVLDDIFTSAVSTGVIFCDHAVSLPLIT